MEIDYKALLKRYMEHIEDREGTTFLWDGVPGILTDEDVKILEELKPE